MEIQHQLTKQKKTLFLVLCLRPLGQGSKMYYSLCKLILFSIYVFSDSIYIKYLLIAYVQSNMLDTAGDTEMN